MYGAMIGDIVGSIYEWHNIKTKKFPFYLKNCHFTDDTVMTLAVAKAIMEGGTRDNFIDSIKMLARKYPNAGYGGKFSKWMKGSDRDPYYSCGNGSAMRVSPCGWLADCKSFAETGVIPAEIREMAALSADVTHNHPEGIKGALAVADAIFLCRYYFGSDCKEELTAEECKNRVKEHIEKEYGYDLSRTLDKIRKKYRFDATCQGSVPEAIIAFLESTDFEDAVRNAISIGGDSDTIAAIAGSIAEAAYGVPEWMKEKALSYLDEPLLEIFKNWEQYLDSLHEKE